MWAIYQHSSWTWTVWGGTLRISASTLTWGTSRWSTWGEWWKRGVRTGAQIQSTCCLTATANWLASLWRRPKELWRQAPNQSKPSRLQRREPRRDRPTTLQAVKRRRSGSSSGAISLTVVMARATHHGTGGQTRAGGEAGGPGGAAIWAAAGSDGSSSPRFVHM